MMRKHKGPLSAVPILVMAMMIVCFSTVRTAQAEEIIKSATTNGLAWCSPLAEGSWLKTLNEKSGQSPISEVVWMYNDTESGALNCGDSEGLTLTSPLALSWWRGDSKLGAIIEFDKEPQLLTIDMWFEKQPQLLAEISWTRADQRFRSVIDYVAVHSDGLEPMTIIDTV